ncbi:MAG: cytochrome c3 family protein [Planctomycetes bacterium]|nr:cytochrome c3 family protein [Planctomycetota bacterium]
MTPRLFAILGTLETVVAAALGLTLARVQENRPGVTVMAEEPLPFDHAPHRFQCTVCHAGALSQAEAGLPGVETCLACHNKEDERKPGPQTDSIRELATRGEDLVWLKYTNVPDHVYFSHVRHTVVARLECQACHGDMARSSRDSMEIVVPTMDACMDCHEEKGVTDDCAACHR